MAEIPGCLVTPEGLTKTTFRVVLRGERVAWTDSDEMAKRDGGWFDTKGLRQGADVMPRTLIFHSLTSTGKSYRVTPIDREAGPERYLVKQPKEFKDFRITGGVVSDNFVYPVLLSSHLGPFQLLEPAQAILPFLRDEGGWRPVSRTALAAIPRDAQVIDRILQAFDTDSQGVFDRIDTDRGKLRALSTLAAHADDDDAWLVVVGAGGDRPAAACRRLADSAAARLVIDQTLYWTVLTGDHAEKKALYLTGMLNSEACDDSIKLFQPQGLLGPRHIHLLAARATPPFDPEDNAHMTVVRKTRALVESLEAALAKEPRLTDVNYSMPHRRRAIRSLLAALPEYEEYDRACRVVYAVDVDEDSRTDDPDPLA